MAFPFNTEYPSIESLRERAEKRMPRFAFEYLDGGCNENINIRRNTDEIREIQLKPRYLKNYNTSKLETELFGIKYGAPFGISPIGLQGLMWPNAPEILAKASLKHNIPFILSTVTTTSIERASELTEGRAWFQLYHPTEEWLRDDILKRAQAAEVPVLVILCDVPTFGYRPKEIRNGLAMPPQMNFRNILQVMGKPAWAAQTLKHGLPNFATMKPYMNNGMSIKQLGKWMNATFSGRLNEEKIKPLRDLWKGKLVLKGVVSDEDAEEAIRLGFDGIIVSNHGGRQLDAGESTIKPLVHISEKYGDQISVMMDSGIRSGPDIARVMSSGADFSFLGRSFMYGVGALGDKGGDHTIAMLKMQLQQVLEQVCCENVKDLPHYLVK
ncbi:lactate dehydrogenase [Salegentibacter salinarum]|uniref:Lactate dehydrogenase n=1 Tax=Salegentibacter salinarum TaxID=447422 RepID=A0A2N0TSK3_9FLAO|nr:alpha-hydroxy acid oxidase [Salegentibacter salinarum]PKD17722.1 lactate dehydrogenase [Salegentibacter salinarum]SKB51552.1 L-lactate dehydrogenase (cytochrome) [Salegentibacter salinarum]